jgi:homoserine kinase type II
MMSDPATLIREDIFDSVQDIFGLTIQDYTRIRQGYLNLKWRIDSASGSFFVKQYNKTRYPERLIDGLEVSLTYQDHLRKQGIPSPQLFANQGKYVLTSAAGERFVLMSLCDGELVAPGTANSDQMYSLGQTTGRMHKLLNTDLAPAPLHWNMRSKESLYEIWNKRWQLAQSKQCQNLLHALEVQKRILDETDPEIFAECEQGWAHWDLFADNILFHPDSVAAILDFDRLHYVYPEFDISRTLLSCALESGTLHLDRVAAFVSGYREFNALSAAKVIRSMKLTWWKESEWVTIESERDSTPIKRFREESMWVGENWGLLQEQLGDL